MLSLGVGGPARTAMTMAQTVFGAADDLGHGGRAAVLDATTGRGPTHAQLAALVGSGAAGLARAGLPPGGVVALHLPDGPEFALALHAVAAAGLVPFPIRVTVPPAELTRLLDASAAVAVITWPVLLGLVRHAIEAARTPPRVVCFGAEPGAEPFGAFLAGGAAPDVDVDPATGTALLVCTRGAGAPPRPVRLSHAEVVSGITRVADSGMIGGTDVVLSGLPLAHVLGLNGLLNPALRLGATVVARPGGGRHELLRALREFGVTVALLDPAQAEALAVDRATARYDLPALRAVVVTGGPFDARSARACAERLHCTVRQAYGLAEAGGFTHLNLRGCEEGTADSVGRGLPGVSWRIVDPATGTDQAAYQPGDLYVRVPVPAPAAKSRWLPAGDAAFADEHGRVYVLGRSGEGTPEPPADPERVLATHPAVRDAAVAPAPDIDLGLVPHAFVVLAETPRGDLLSFVNAQVAPSRRVAAVHVVDAIPRTDTGRVRRRTLLRRAGLTT